MSGGFLDDSAFSDQRPRRADSYQITDLLFLGFNSRVLAMDRDTGALIWSWKAPKGRSSYVAVLVDDGQLFVSIDGYTYCLDPFSGDQLWFNGLKGFGYGLPTLATAEQHTNSAGAAEMRAREQRRRNSSAQ
ncbi:outer membrane protein assembly factor BamB family protein [Gimesia panareensis]|uniref:outer membrane protein assembly factor BamB family protein n=1 Tax=Gimesia panareensis TaxID=2527978 RepID=UPI00118B5620|nr:PQQ-binding-like beta-propeller repeat protein [Gimesia panareensis]QDU52759.1 PQQ enzyme repeat protein [Gimesia panareensis]